VNSYGLDRNGGGLSFASLLREVAAIEGIRRLRFTTSHPKDLSDEVIEAFGDLPELCPSLHLPLQSGSDRILKAMGRRYDLAHYLRLVERLYAARPDLHLTTDLIVGFPGETEEDFQATLAAMQAARFGMSFSFCYSDRPGTRAEAMEGKIPDDLKHERLERLQRLQEDLTEQALATTIGQTLEVLVEGENKRPDQPAQYAGRDPHGRVVNLQAPPGLELAGKLVLAVVTEAKRHSLLGEKAGEPW